VPINRERFRGIIAVVIATTMCAVVVLVVIGRIWGIPITELGRTAAITLVGALAAALGAYLTTGRKP
jgi:small-conductance mechanosensitive channel